MLNLLDHQAFADESEMTQHAVLLKAITAAKIGGIESIDGCEHQHPSSPAILDAAHRHSCVRLFAGSHGRLPDLRVGCTEA